MVWFFLVFYRMFGFVARRSGGLGNVCHLFAELDPEQPATAIVNFINKVMLGPQQLRKWTQYREMEKNKIERTKEKRVVQWILLHLYTESEECWSLGWTKKQLSMQASTFSVMFTCSKNQCDKVRLKLSALWSDFKLYAFYWIKMNFMRKTTTGHFPGKVYLMDK